jgi:hypothetical protein
VTFLYMCTVFWFVFFIIPPIPLHLLKMTSTVSMFRIHTCIENKLTIFTLLYPLHSPSPTTNTLPYHDLVYISVLYWLFVHCSVGFCLGILPVNILYFNQSTPPLLFLSLFPLPCIIQQFSVFSFVLFLHRCDIFQLFTLSFSSSFPPALASSNSHYRKHVLYYMYT